MGDKKAEKQFSVHLKNVTGTIWFNYSQFIMSTLSVCLLSISVGLADEDIIQRVKDTGTADIPGSLRQFRISRESLLWLGIVLDIVKPIACIASGLLQDVIGRKPALIVAYTLQLSATALFCLNTIGNVALGTVLLSFSSSFMEVPMTCYIGETTQPTHRGILSTLPVFFQNLGSFLSRWVTSLSRRRTFMIVPAFGLISMMKVPESPAWLVAKDRREGAEGAYRWLRGWARSEDIQDEMISESNLDVCRRSSIQGYNSSKRKLSLMLRDSETRMGLKIIIVYIVVNQVSNLTVINTFFAGRPNSSAINTTIQVDQVLDYGGLAENRELNMAGAFFMALCIHSLGKRVLTFVSLGLGTSCTLFLGIYILVCPNYPKYPLAQAVHRFSTYCGSLGAETIPWILVVELFPIRVRGIAAGVCLAAKTSLQSVMDRTSHIMISLIGYSGVCFLYVGVSIFGIFYLYRTLPETEGKTLEEIRSEMA